MKIRVERSVFLDAVLKMQKTVGAKSSMPVLEGILISAEKGLLTLSSYNLEMGMKKEMYASCEEEGDIVINARLLADILRKLRGIDVEIESDERLVCHIRSGEAVFDIMGRNSPDQQLRSRNAAKCKMRCRCKDSQEVGLEAAIP